MNQILTSQAEKLYQLHTTQQQLLPSEKSEPSEKEDIIQISAIFLYWFGASSSGALDMQREIPFEEEFLKCLKLEDSCLGAKWNKFN